MVFEEMFLSLGQQAWMFIRVLLAGICGSLIGMERSRRQKEAGVRTHMLVAMGAALAMVISKYGFADVVIYNSIQIDASRIASNVMTGVGFLGAGMIFTKSGSVKGLTTAAGIWATAGIGMAIGSGLYLLGIATTLVILAVHMNKSFISKFENNATDAIEVVVDNKPEVIEALLSQLEEHDIRVITSDIHKLPDNTIKMVLAVKMKRGIAFEETMRMMAENPSIKSFIS